jgi:plastocyanin/uncharacterized membrane protein
MTPFVAAWRVRQGIAVLILLSGSSISIAHPRFGVANLRGAALALVQASGTASQNLSAAGPSENGQVIMKGIRFQPAELTVHPGETVEFKNEDIVAHTVTADDGSFDSGLIQPGSSWKMTVQKAGTVAYHCTPHPNMKATLVTSSSGTQTKGKNGAARGLPGFRSPRSPQELHPILVNFTAALLPLALFSDLLGRWLKRSSLQSAAAWMVLYAAIITPLTGAAGWWWKIKSAGTLPPDLIAVHEWLGTSLAVVFIALAVWRWHLYRKNAVPTLAYLVFALVAMLALVYQGSLGGAMVFGR